MSLHTRQLLHHDHGYVQEWFARPGAVRRLTPGRAPLTPISEAASLRDGITEFRLPAGLRWRARHTPEGYVAGSRFVDEVANQPFAAITGWRHAHYVEAATGPNGERWCIVGDDVDARIPALGLESLFAFRHTVLAADLAAADRLAGYLDLGHGTDSGRLLPHRTIAVTGSSGTVGSALCALLTTSGHRVIRLVRSPREAAAPDTRHWDPARPSPRLLDDVDALIHLAGEPIAGRFTDKHLEAVRSSRVEPTRALAHAVAAAGTPVVVSASAVGYYGPDRGREILTETSVRGDGPLAAIVGEWERAWDPAREAGARVSVIRTGLVQAGGGGLLPMLARIVSTGLGGRLGKGNQWFPWIALDDLLDIYHRAVLDPDLAGPINAVAPGGVDNAEFTKTLAKVLRRPAAIPVPKFGPALLLGSSGADELAFANQRVEPAALVDAGHIFRYNDLEPALRHELAREELRPYRGDASV
ncbi:TIGR01777 family oxidoreductase [Dietzia timorensis]|uniref:Epimerase family protein n=1 Tax=Dietzia timorensis TaxID=499555 RepID=A0A173LN37_9ACTN|nr:TIGR01777 family oxidoreductase [Dietzia timorensis]ANI93049.1 Epimerase family protein [Dietzia timorensis]